MKLYNLLKNILFISNILLINICLADDYIIESYIQPENSIKIAKNFYTSKLDCNKILKNNNFIKNCQKNTILKISDNMLSDTWIKTQWALNAVKAYAGWQFTTGSKEIVVAVLDTGIDYNHEDLINNIFYNKNEIPNNNIDDDNNGYIDDVNGISIITNNNYDDNGHGTHIAGIIAAQHNNIGIAGIAPNIKILSIKFLDKNGYGTNINEILGYNYILSMKKRGVNIVAVNASYGGSYYSKATYNIIKKLNEEGIMVICAAGNEKNNNDKYKTYPASYDLDNIISVTSIREENNGYKFSNFSNYGITTVDIAAPGSSIFSTYPQNNYIFLSGTSMAAPHVTGAIGLYGSLYPIIPSYIKYRVKNTGTYYNFLVNKVASKSILNIEKFLTAEFEDNLLYKIKLKKLKRKLQVELLGIGNKDIEIYVKINRKKCKNTIKMIMLNGYAVKKFSIKHDYSNIILYNNNLISNKIAIKNKKPSKKIRRFCKAFL